MINSGMMGIYQAILSDFASFCSRLRKAIHIAPRRSPPTCGVREKRDARLGGLIAIALMLLLIAGGSAPGATRSFGPFHINDAETLIRLEGRIGARDAVNFKKALRAAPKARTIDLDSPGGSLIIALAIAEDIIGQGFRTRIPKDDQCLSACALLFFAGETREAEGDLGVHQIASTKSGDFQFAQAALADVLDFFRRANVDPQITQLMLATPPDAMHVFSSEEIDRYGIDRIVALKQEPSESVKPENHPCEVLVDPDAEESDLLVRNLFPVITACQQAITAHPDENQRFRELLQIAREQEAFQLAVTSPSQAVSRAYLDKYPSGRFVTSITRHLAALQPPKDLAPPDPQGRPSPTPQDQDPGASRTIDEASLEAPSASESQETELNRRDLIVALQQELARVGCEPGPADGIWGRNSVRALENFTQHADASLRIDPSAETLAAVRGAKTRVCPLNCGPREVERSGRCVAKTCPTGQRMNSRGVCYTPRAETVQKKRKAPVASSSSTRSRRSQPSRQSNDCFQFNGETVC